MRSDEENLSPLTSAAEFDERIYAANDRLAVETDVLREQNQSLHDLVARYQNYAARLEKTLVELQSEQAVMDAEVRRLLSPEEQAALKSLITR